MACRDDAGVIPRLRIHFAAHAVNAPHWRWDSRRNRWTGHLLWYVSAGRGEIRWPEAGLAVPVRAGSCFLFDMTAHHLGSNDADAPLAVHAIGFHRAGIAGPDPLWPRFRRWRTVQAEDALRAELDAGIEAHAAGRARVATTRLRAALDLLRREDQRPVAAGPAAARARAVDDLCAAIRADPAGDWASARLQRRLGCGREHVIELFRRHAGRTPAAFVAAARLALAQRLLADRALSIASVATRCGYDDPFHFSRRFRAATGQSPRAWRAALGGEDWGIW